MYVFVLSIQYKDIDKTQLISNVPGYVSLKEDNNIFLIRDRNCFTSNSSALVYDNLKDWISFCEGSHIDIR